MEASHSLLVRGLSSRGVEEGNAALALDFFSGLVAAFELNNMTIQVDSPLLAACQGLNKMSGEVKAQAAAVMQKKVQQALHLKTAYEASGEEEEAGEEEELVATLREMRLMGGRAFEPLEGTAMFSCLCTMNHSCAPNCLVAYDTTTADKLGGPAEACVFATKATPPPATLTLPLTLPLTSPPHLSSPLCTGNRAWRRANYFVYRLILASGRAKIPPIALRLRVRMHEVPL